MESSFYFFIDSLSLSPPLCPVYYFSSPPLLFYSSVFQIVSPPPPPNTHTHTRAQLTFPCPSLGLNCRIALSPFLPLINTHTHTLSLHLPQHPPPLLPPPPVGFICTMPESLIFSSEPSLIRLWSGNSSRCEHSRLGFCCPLIGVRVQVDRPEIEEGA